MNGGLCERGRAGPAELPLRKVTVEVATADVVRRGEVTSLLERGGFAVVGEASTASSAAALAHDVEPDVCLLDLDLRGDPVAACRAIVNESPHTTVIAFTVSLAGPDLPEVFEAGAKGCVLSVHDPEGLAASVSAILEGDFVIPRSVVYPPASFVRRMRARRASWARWRRKPTLTQTESEIVLLLDRGVSVRRAAEQLGMDDDDVVVHLRSVLGKIRRDRFR